MKPLSQFFPSKNWANQKDWLPFKKKPDLELIEWEIEDVKKLFMLYSPSYKPEIDGTAVAKALFNFSKKKEAKRTYYYDFENGANYEVLKNQAMVIELFWNSLKSIEIKASKGIPVPHPLNTTQHGNNRCPKCGSDLLLDEKHWATQRSYCPIKTYTGIEEAIIDLRGWNIEEENFEIVDSIGDLVVIDKWESLLKVSEKFSDFF